MGMGHFFRLLNFYHCVNQKEIKVVFVLLGSHVPAESWLQKLGIVYEVVTGQSEQWELDIVKRYQPKVWINDRLDTDLHHVQLLKSLDLIVVSFDDAGSGARYLDLQVAALAPARGQSMAGHHVLTGLEYLILPQEVQHYRRMRTSDNKLVVNLGGSDTYGVTVQIVKWLQARHQPATVILGPGFMHEEELNQVSVDDSINFKRSVPSLAAEFASFDLAITGGGLTAFEAAAAGLPTLTVANELYEISYCRYLQDIGCSKYSGFRNEANLDILDGDWEIKKMSEIGLNQVNLSGAENICRVLIQLYREKIEESL
jgi:spore coat polysaccharide biosynthesis predicted glycosyltransferase SpsG